MSGPRVDVYDTTLRDGTQREGISLSLDDKLRIARRLDRLGVAYIEAGWPGSNPKDAEFFERAADLTWDHARITAFGSTRRQANAAEHDPGLLAQLAAGTPACALFGKSSPLHVTEILRTTKDENLRMIEDSVAFLVAAGREVVYDAEHFFDGYAADPAYAVETLRAAAAGGASVLVLCDTNGGSLPWQVTEAVEAVAKAVDAPLGIHTHDDAGCGVANALAAVAAGARHVQGTINGYGERCGNANLCAVIPGVELKLGLPCLPDGGLGQLREVSLFVAAVANLAPDEHMAYVGRSAFAHKGGVHVAAIRRNVDSYQHVEPEAVGNKMRVVVSELSGRGNVRTKAEEIGASLSTALEAEVLEDIKAKEARGYAFEAAEASVSLMIARAAEAYEAPFVVRDFKVLVGHKDDGRAYAEATVKVAVGAARSHTAAEGSGPVEALDRALRKALIQHHPALEAVHLADYKVRILDGKRATAAITRVLIDWRDGASRWSTVGASSNIIEASFEALVDGLEYALLQGPSEG